MSAIFAPVQLPPPGAAGCAAASENKISSVMSNSDGPMGISTLDDQLTMNAQEPGQTVRVPQVCLLGFDVQLPSVPLVPLGVLFPLPEVRRADELWPAPGTPEPNLQARGLTEARCVIEFFHGRTPEDKLDALKHLANICVKKAGGGYWSPQPYLKFTGASTSKKDWENSDPRYPWLRKNATRGWFLIQLPEHIDRYSPQHVTRRELLELARIRDKDLLHVCHALVCDLFNESEKQQRNEIGFSTLLEQDGQGFYWDDKLEVTVEPTATPSFTPDYAGAVEMLVKDKKLRDTLSPRVCRTLEIVLRKLAAGMDADEIIPAVADVIKRDERTVRRHLSTSRKTAGGKVMDVLARFVLPDRAVTRSAATPSRPQVDALAESVALKSV
jgi:hypothetical protein